MTQKADITLGQLRHPSNLNKSLFLVTYKKLLMGKRLSTEEKTYLLELAIYFLNSTDQDIERLGYRIVLRYSNRFQDYRPLYDVALSREYIPITKFIENKSFIDDKPTFSSVFLAAFQENFRLEGDDQHIYRSKGQMDINTLSSLEDNIAIIAPTSYGKSEAMLKKIELHPNSIICIIVPSKALLAQTKRNLLKNSTIQKRYKKIITHPDMYREGDSVLLAVLTQERLLRLLLNNPLLSFDIVFVDEAHNILEEDERARLLAQVLLILHKRNPQLVINFFTPFLVDEKNLKIINQTFNLKGKPLNEYMKIESFYAVNLKGSAKYMALYDQFLDEFFYTQESNLRSDIDFLLNHVTTKNIIYLNRPKDAENIALEMAEKSNKISLKTPIEKIINSISELIDPEYNLIQCIKSGVVYHHGGIPDTIRLYIEDIFSNYLDLRFIVTTSTLLEGVNIPAEKIFLLTPVKGRRTHLTPSQFKNLIGRVCRFREVFDPNNGSLALLEPEIFLLNGEYAPKDFNVQTFYHQKANVGKKPKDNVENPLLENSKSTESRKEALEYLENMEPGSSGLEVIQRPKTEIGHLCYRNNISDFNILDNEETLARKLANYKDLSLEIDNPSQLIGAINAIFLTAVTLNQSSKLGRFKDNEKARAFYALFIGWRSESAPYPRMIKQFLGYWKTREQQGDTLIYVGTKWGEIPKNGFQELYVNIATKSETERINLAIARIKEEHEFVDFQILKYVEVLNGLNLINGEFYDRVKYGTSNKHIICMLKNGLSLELAKLLEETYKDYLKFNLKQDTISYSPKLLKVMRANSENDVLIFELTAILPHHA